MGQSVCIPRAAALLAVALMMFSEIDAVAADSQKAFVPPDCGANALYLLLNDTGARVDLAEVQNSLPEQTPDGYSFLTLKMAAQKLGFRCRGVQIGKGHSPPDTPAIAFVGGPDHGHFFVIRPVGSYRRTLVQVLDPPYKPIVVEYEKIESDPHWSGTLLIVESRLEAIGGKVGLACFAMFAVLPLTIKSIRSWLSTVARNWWPGRREWKSSS